MTPKISVVVPSYNQGIYLDDCIRSILNQGYPSLELLVMDGGSDDESVETIQSHREAITYWRSAKDDGQAAAINEGFARATGDVLCWLNSDDMYLPGTLRDIGERFGGAGSEKRLCYGASVVIRQGAGSGDEPPMAVAASSQSFDAEMLTYSDYIVQPSSFWTRALWEETGLLRADLHFAFDWEWFLRASAHTEFEYVPKFYSIYRQHAAHKSGQGSAKRRQELLSILKRYAPPYWKELYSELDRCYPQLQERDKMLVRWNRRELSPLLALFFPRLFLHLRKRQDLATAISMWN